ncbi:MAG TPA: hypothetical protein PKC98_09610 [Candidatus Melainabacteria bacterium]|nr:hypothetical protein [Candidatus Melainabacteria bacterium]
MGNTESPAKQRELVAESGHSVKLSLEHQIIHLDRLQGSSASEKIYKSLAEIGSKPPFISAGVLIHKSRLFDEGLFAQLEKLLQNGLGRFMGKKVFLKKLAESLLTKFPEPPTKDSTAKDSNKAVSCILAACRLGKIKLDQRENEFKNWQEYLNQFLTEFEMNPVLSRPTSFYCQDEELKTIFKQDRILQTPLKLLEDGKSAQAVAETIKGGPNLFNTYMTYLEIIARISNPLRIPDLSILFGDSGDDNIKFDIEVAAIIPPLVSHEEDLLARIIGPGNSVPENFSLLDEFIKFIKARKVSLRPTAESGWYDYSTWSLAPLVSLSSMVESKHLEIEEVYADLLEELFRGRVKRKENENNGSTGDSDAKYSESKAKSETGPGSSSAFESAPPRIQVTIEPSLRVEPLPTFYYRKGFSYKFIRNILLTIFEEDDLRSVKRATTSGEARIDLLSELEFMENLFYGAHRSTCADLGMDPAQTPENCEVVFETWAQNFLTDLDLQPDSRSMIPIAYDVEKRKTRVRCFFGWRKETILVAFARPPEVEIYSKSGKKMPRKDLWLRPTYVGNEGQTGDEISYSFTNKRVDTFYPVIDEIEVEKLLDNKAFQEQLDRSGISAFIEKSS